MAVTTPVSCTNRLSMAIQVGREPGWIDRIGLKFGEELRVVDHIEAFGQIDKAEKSDFLAVDGGKDMIRDGKERGFCGKTGAETVLG